MPLLIRKTIDDLLSDARFAEILSGSAWALVARVFAALFALVFSIMVARLYGAKVMGIVAVINSFMIMTSVFTVLGTNTSILRLIPEHVFRYSSRSALLVYRKINIMIICISLIVGGWLFFGAGPIADKVFNKPHFKFYFSLAAAFIVFKSLTELNTHAIRGLKRVRAFALMQTLPQFTNLTVLLVLGLVVAHPDVPVYAFLSGFAVTGIVGWVVVEMTFKSESHPDGNAHPMPVKEILSISVPMLLTATMNFLIGQTGVIMLGIFRTEDEIGYYDISVKLATLTAFIITAVNSIAAPKFSELFHSDKIDDLFYVAKKSTKLIFWTTTPILVVLIVFGRPLLGAAFGQEFVVAYPALVVLVIGQFVNSVSGSTSLFMNMTGQQNLLRNIMLGTATMNILLNYILIPIYGISGAAVSAAVAMSSWNIATLMFIKQRFGRTTSYFPYISEL